MFYWMLIFVVLLAGVEFYLLFRVVEHWWCLILKKQIPYMASDKKLRNAVVQYIKKSCLKKPSVCEIGAGYGWLARCVAKKCGASVVALENMPFTFWVAKILQALSGNKSVQWVRCDAFRFLGNCNKKFDVGVAYLGPGVNDRLGDYLWCFDVLIVLDVPIANVKPFDVVDVGGGFTRYGRLKFPHKLFIYKN